MEYEFRDKEYLSSYSLNTKLFDKFSFEVTDAAPIRSVFLLTTDQGYKIFKKVRYGIDEIKFLYNTLNKIKEKYPYLINFKENTLGEPYTFMDGEIYVVFDLIEGRECMYENPVDIRTTALGLSKYHLAADIPGLFYKNRCLSGKIPNNYKRCIRELENYKKIAKLHVNKSEFDSIYLEFCDYYIECCKRALSQLQNSEYFNICNKKRVLCHHDLAHHNIMLGNDDRVYFVDFDYAVIDLPYHDLSNFITKAAKKNNWDLKILDIIINSYCSISELKPEDIAILLGYLMFPVDFYDISKSYYMRTKSWEEEDFVFKIKRKAGYKEQREELLNYFENTF